jgi:hypothetical protein
MSFRAGGYTPARNKPVRKRSGSPIAMLSTTVNSKFANVAPMEPPRMTCLGETISERFRKLEMRAPHTKPSCTAIVSHAAV